jgi:hypothetical protein
MGVSTVSLQSRQGHIRDFASALYDGSLFTAFQNVVKRVDFRIAALDAPQ